MLSDQVRQWLADVECPLEYVDLFERHGYFKLSFIAGMTAEVLPCLYVVVYYMERPLSSGSQVHWNPEARVYPSIRKGC